MKLTDYLRLPFRRNQRRVVSPTKSGGPDRSYRFDRFEQMEHRQLLSVQPLTFGAVFIEEDIGNDQEGDVFVVTFMGGAPQTQLTRLEIQGDQNQIGFGVGDVFFDSFDTGLGADHAFPLTIVSSEGIQNIDRTVVDGSSRLLLELTGFEAGEHIVFSVDVDEVEFFDPVEHDRDVINEGFDPIASGVEFQGTQLTAYFSAPHFLDASSQTTFLNRYDPTGLALPPDDHNGKRDRTAGAIDGLEQRPRPISIAGTVFEDDNLDLERDGLEVGIADVVLSLWTREDGDFIETGFVTRTDDGGHYRFGRGLGLLPGEYQIRQEQPTGYFSVGAISGTVNGMQSGQGSPLDPDILSNIEIPLGGTEAINFDFAEARPISIEGNVHLSSGGGNCFGSELHRQPVEGARVELHEQNGNLRQAATSDARGDYRFEALPPGIYKIVEFTPEHLFDGGAHLGQVVGQPVGSVVDAGTIAAITIPSGVDATGFDFCEHAPASISGFVFHDRNNDAKRGTNEEGIADVTVSLLGADGNVFDTQVSAENGAYGFSRLPQGEYSLVESHPDGWLDGTDAVGTIDGVEIGTVLNTGDMISDIRLDWGEEAVEYNFAELVPASISGNVHLSSREGDCFGQQTVDRAVTDVVILLQDQVGNVVAETVTDALGNYRFNGLAPGIYTIVEQTPQGLIDGGEHIATIDSGVNGVITFDDTISGIQLGSGQRLIGYDFCEHEPASIRGMVFHDRDNDTRPSTAEETIDGVEIQLVNENTGQTNTTFSDAAGRFQFTGLSAGTYALRERQPAAWLDGFDRAGTVSGRTVGHAVNPGDELRRIELKWGDEAVDYTFGEQKPGSISGLVHTDIQRDCEFSPDIGEQGLSGVILELLGSRGTVLQSTVTDSAGRYQFDGVPPGEYTIRQQQPAGMFDGQQRAGHAGGDATGTNQIGAVRVESGDQLHDYNFCEEPPAVISGYVFQDGAPISVFPGEGEPRIHELRDGKLTSDDTRLPNVRLGLHHGLSGEPLGPDSALPGMYSGDFIQTMTDHRGFYEFVGLAHGVYAVYETQPEGFLDGIDTPGTLSGVAFNRVEIQPLSSIVTLSVDPQHDAIIRISMPPGSRSLENNFSEVRVSPIMVPPPAPPLPPITPPLTPTNVAPDTAVDLRLSQLSISRLPLTIDSYGSSGVPFTWHLSVVDAGRPRGSGLIDQNQMNVWLASADYRHVGWSTVKLDQGVWTMADTNDEHSLVGREFTLGRKAAIAVSGDFNGDGIDEIGIFYRGHWYIDLNANGIWDEEDLWAKLGRKSDVPITGDWDGDGKEDIGIFGHIWPGDSRALKVEPGLPDNQNAATGQPKNVPPSTQHATTGRRLLQLTARGRTRSDVIDHVFSYGLPGDSPVVGDWNGDGIHSIGIFRGGLWHLDVDGDGRWSDSDRVVEFGQTGDQPVVGDFNGDGVDELGFFRDGKFFLDSNANGKLDAEDRVFDFGPADGHPVVGDWDGDGKDEVAVYRPAEKPKVDSTARKAG